METILCRAGTVFRLTSERITGDAAVLAVYAGSGADHDGAFWTADPIAAVAAGRLQTEPKRKKGSGTSAKVLFATFYCLKSAVEK